MASGGARTNAGRPKGAATRSRAAIESAKARLAELGLDTLAALTAIAQDPATPVEQKVRVLIELNAYAHPKPRPEPTRRPIKIPGDTLEERGRNVFVALEAGELSSDEAAALISALAEHAKVEQLGLVADVVAKLAADRGIEVPAELRLRQRIPATLQGKADEA